ncbi:MAG: hypothetical protein AAFO01_01675 [Pseudomonadota bacterium]
MRKGNHDMIRRPMTHRLKGMGAFGLATFLGLAALSGAPPAHGQQGPQTHRLTCATYENMTKFLSTKFTEAPRSIGIASDGKVLQVFTTEGGESWTMVATAPEGRSCIVAAGKYWQEIPIEPKGPKI